MVGITVEDLDIRNAMLASQNYYVGSPLIGSPF